MPKVKLRLLNIDGYHINLDKGEIVIRNLIFSFDPSASDIKIDFLEAIKLALKEIESGRVTVKAVN